MRTSRVSADDQYRLIMECRRSGLSDQQWCMDHDVKPGTFYNWVKRLRQKGCQDIPTATGRVTGRLVEQEVVRIERNQMLATSLPDTSLGQLPASMELSIGNLKLKIPNGTDPMLLAQTIKVLSEPSMLGDITVADEIYIVTNYTDMRKSIDGLCAVVEDQLKMDPRRSALYLFCGKRCDRIKALLWESDGFVLLYKKMEVQGRFRWPRSAQEVRQLTWQQFDWLMSGLEIEQPKAFKPTD